MIGDGLVSWLAVLGVTTIGLVLSLPAWLVLAQCARARIATMPQRPPPGHRPRLAVVVPAHDEEGQLAATLESLVPQLETGDRLVVVAHNCKDATAVIADRSGVEVVALVDDARIGKGYALEAGFGHLAADPPALVVVVDADCVVEPHALDRLAATCTIEGHPAQALYRMEPPMPATWSARFAHLGWTLKNHTRPLGMAAMGRPCSLFGSGMALPWNLARVAPVAHGRLVEDMELALDLALAGHAPVFCPDALVTSRFPSRDRALGDQARRWEHGHVALIARRVPMALWQGLRRADRRLVWLALDTAVPPITWMAAALGVVVLAAGALAASTEGARALVAVIAAAWSALTLAALAGAVAIHARIAGTPLTAHDWLHAALHAAAKLPRMVGVVHARHMPWVRSERDQGPGRGNVR